MKKKNSKKVRVLNITPSGDLGGRERQILSISQSLKDNQEVQFDVFFIKAQGPFYDASLREGIVTMSLPSGVTNTIPYYLRVMKSYDIINYWGVNWQAYLAGILSGAIMTFSLQGARGVIRKRIKDIFFEKLFKKDSIENVKSNHKINVISDSIWKNRLIRFLKKWLLIHSLRRCDVVIAPSQYLCDFCISYYGLRVEQVKLIKNSVNFESIKTTKSKGSIRLELGLEPDVFLVGVAARYDARKRLDRLIEALGNLREYDKIKGVIYGGGDATIKNKLDLQVAQHKIEMKILFPGFRDDIYNYINALDVFVLPSDSEGMGLAIVESVYLGCPTVVFQDGGGVLEVIKNRKTGYVVNDVKELSELIISLYKNPGMSQDICKEGKTFVMENFDVQKTAKEYADVFVKLVR
ncbi:glycosyltransferase family 4 protein [bacterium]|nr:MAG: glycosyltransferase family 4 protein [bacterium]